MKYTELANELKNVMIGSSRVWMEIPMNLNYPNCKKLLNISNGTIITIYLDQNADILKIE
tara:strand:- start:89 stop:268 length:180 start_codon:yes stop_codon:yes gene_type:complete